MNQSYEKEIEMFCKNYIEEEFENVLEILEKYKKEHDLDNEKIIKIIKGKIKRQLKRNEGDNNE